MNSKNLEFRRFEYDDFDDLNEILSNPNVCQYLPGKGGYSEEIVLKWLKHFIRTFEDEHGSRLFAILEKGNNKVIGYGGLGYVKEFDAIEIMYGFNESVWGKGYGTEFSIRMREYARELGMTDIIALADVRNIASQKILLKTGFIEKKRMPLWGLDVIYYEMELL